MDRIRSQEESLTEVFHLFFGKKRTLEIWGTRAEKIARSNPLYSDGRGKKFHSIPPSRLSTRRKEELLFLLFEKGVPLLDCILFARLLPSEVLSRIEKRFF